MKCKILIDNTPFGQYCAEWGLAVYIEYNGKKLLLDTGASLLFAENAEKMGVDLSEIDFGILSHAHFDHSDGMDAFFARNQKAKFHLRAGCGENCYDRKESGMEYIGVRRGLLGDYPERIVYVDGDFELMPGVWLIPHKTPNLDEIGKRIHMFTLEDGAFVPERFAHEQSLVIETSKGLVIFNSCSHGGADNIITEVAATFPGKRLYALIGGFHLFRSTAQEVEALARRMAETGIERIVTGHCTGDAAAAILREHFGDRMLEMYSGLEFEIE